ncbi:MAG TPA: tetratricopeptide repeat protein [Vicinamibacterales bacterium]|jgi:TolA-binding protein|nr:tetratricopeptide repeat protein [Vicinamibacterales bacterium]
MKAHERHQLKENDFLKTTVAVTKVVRENRNVVALGLAAVIVVAGAVGGWMFWRTHRANEAGALLGIAMATAQAPIAPAPSLPGATQTPGTFPTEQARAEATITLLTQAADAYPNTNEGIAARYQLGSELLSVGRLDEAQAAFAKVVASGSSLYASLARLGEAQAFMAAGKTDEAIKIYTDLAAARDSALPVDGLLMELARASQKAGKPQDARAAFKRVVDEFPDSTYAADARQQLAALN